jgi:Domain of unknown function (DUF4158)
MKPFLTCSPLPHRLHRSPIAPLRRPSQRRPIWAIYALLKPWKNERFLVTQPRMAHRTILTDRQRAALLGLPTGEAAHLQFYVLGEHDLGLIGRRRRPWNRLGFALQLCAFRYPGRLIQPGEAIPETMLAFIGAQLGFTVSVLHTP